MYVCGNENSYTMMARSNNLIELAMHILNTFCNTYSATATVCCNIPCILLCVCVCECAVCYTLMIGLQLHCEHVRVQIKIKCSEY